MGRTPRRGGGGPCSSTGRPSTPPTTPTGARRRWRNNGRRGGGAGRGGGRAAAVRRRGEHVSPRVCPQSFGDHSSWPGADGSSSAFIFPARAVRAGEGIRRGPGGVCEAALSAAVAILRGTGARARGAAVNGA